jgi:hypothetical protein
LEAQHRRRKRSAFGDRRWAESQVTRVDVINFHSYARRVRADAPTLCPGDSGGPVMYKGKVVGVHGAAFGLDTGGGARSNMAANLMELKRWQVLSEPGPTNPRDGASSPGGLQAE